MERKSIMVKCQKKKVQGFHMSLTFYRKVNWQCVLLIIFRDIKM